MPKCINDPTRSYTGKEPSPKGRGYCAHAQTEGDREKGRDGAMWTVVADKHGRLAWRKTAQSANSANSAKSTPGSRLTYSIRKNKFSDGTSLSWTCQAMHPNRKGSLMSNVAIYGGDSDPEVGITAAHWSASIGRPTSKTSGATVRMWSNNSVCPSETVRVPAPVNIRGVMSAMAQWYGRAATTKQLREAFETGKWSYKTFGEFKRCVKTVGDLQGEHHYFEGFSGTPARIVVAKLGSLWDNMCDSNTSCG